MSNAYLSPILNDAQFNDDGTFLVGGLIWFYEAGTSTPAIAYTDPTAATAWPNPIQLDQRGETGGEIWLSSGQSYKLILEEPPAYGQTHGVVVSTFDNISGVNDPGTISIQNWVDFSGTPTYYNSSVFTLTGDQRAIFTENRRVRMTNSDASVYYGTVVSSSYATGTTAVTVSPDYGQSVSSYINAVAYGFVETGPTSSIPVAVNAGSYVSGSQYQMWMNYDGANLTWSKDSDAPTSHWPITSTYADQASAQTFGTAIATSGEAQLTASCIGVNDAYLFNSPTRWGIYSADGGSGVEYTRATNTFAFGGFTLPSPASTKYIKLPNGLIIQFGQGTASNAGTSVAFATSFPAFCVSVVCTQVGTTHVAVSANNLTTANFTAYAASTEPCSYIAFGY